MTKKLRPEVKERNKAIRAAIKSAHKAIEMILELQKEAKK